MAEHILSLSYGKDSMACLFALEKLGWPLDRIVTADVTPVRHSQWVVRYDGLYECSSCKKEALYKAVRDGFGNAYFEQELSDSCPYCVAKMDGGNCDD